MITIKNAVLRVLLISIISATAMSVYAGGIFKVKPSENGGKAVVRIANFETKNLTLSIEDEYQNQVFYKESVSGDSDFAKVFDLSLLDDGEYVFIVNTGNEVLTESFEVVGSKLTVKDFKKLKEPIFRVKENVLLIYFHNDNEAYASINFYDETENFFTDELEGSALSNVKQYSLAELPAGNYLVSVQGINTTFRYSFEID